MLGLAIESADRTASAALWRSNLDCAPNIDVGSSADRAASGPCRVIAVSALPPEVGKADQLITVIERLLAEHGVTYDALDLIAVNRGPGSFTGIRSAVALSRGLALATDLPVLAVTSHEALATDIAPDVAGRPLLIALDARRGQVYDAAFSAEGSMVSAIQARSPRAVAADLGDGHWRFAGSGAHLVAEALDGAVEVEMIVAPPIDATAVARAAAKRLAGGEAPGEGSALRPLYMRAPDAVPPPPLISRTSALQGSI